MCDVICIEDEANEFTGEIVDQMNQLDFAIPCLTPEAFYANMFNISYNFKCALERVDENPALVEDYSKEIYEIVTHYYTINPLTTDNLIIVSSLIRDIIIDHYNDAVAEGIYY